MDSKIATLPVPDDAAEMAVEKTPQNNAQQISEGTLDDDFFSAENIASNRPPEIDFEAVAFSSAEDQSVPPDKPSPSGEDLELVDDPEEYPTIELDLCFSGLPHQSECPPTALNASTLHGQVASDFAQREPASEMDDLTAALANPLDLLDVSSTPVLPQAAPIMATIPPIASATDAEELFVSTSELSRLTEVSTAEGLTLDAVDFGVEDDVLAEMAEEPSLTSPQEFFLPHMDVVPRYMPFVVDCGLGRFALSGSQARRLSDEEVLQHWHLLMADFSIGPGPGVLLVETAPKYAHVLAQRTLQRNGDLADDVDFRPLTRRRTAATQTQLSYHLPPKQQLARLQAQAERSAQGFLLHSTETLLYGLLCTWPREQTIGLLMHLPQTLLLVVGKDRNIVCARRYTLASDEGTEFQSSVSAVLQEMHLAAREGGFDVDAAIWIEGWSASAVMPQDQESPLHYLPVLPLQEGERVWYSALPGLLERMDHSLAFTPVADRALARLQPWEKWLWAISLLAGLFLGGAGWWLGENTRLAEQRLEMLTQHKAVVQQNLADAVVATSFPEAARRGLDLALETTQTLRKAQLAPPLAVLWNHIAELRPLSCRIQALEISYAGPVVQVRLEGNIELSLTQAQAVFSEFLNALEHAGLRVVQHDFRLDLDTNFFTVMLEKAVEE